MKTWFREPLVHFIVLGGLLFVVHGLWSGARERSDYTITITPDELARQATLFAGENRREPTEAELQGLLFNHVEEQALAREAARLGLDSDDVIIRRRLAQKMRFMIQDAGTPALPEPAVLQSWFSDREAEFLRPERRAFEHIYFSPKQRADAEADARAVLAAGPGDAWDRLGDPFMNPRRVGAQTQDDIRKNYGTAFATSVFALDDSGAWQGPVPSAFGVHLVRLRDIRPAVQPAFAEIRETVEDAWLAEAEAEQNRAALQELIEKYDVVVED